MTINLLELFAGYGGASFALKRAGIDHTLIGYSEWDKYAADVFEQNHGGGKLGNLGDVTQINWHSLKGEDINLITGGTPCQNFSVAGKRDGTHYKNGKKTQSGLIFDYMDAIDILRPEVFIFENVGGAMSSKNQHGQKIIPLIETAFRSYGYTIDTNIVKAKDYGLAQSRPRIVIVGIHNSSSKTFKLPEWTDGYDSVQDYIIENADPALNLSDDYIINYIIKRSSKYLGIEPCDKLEFAEILRQRALKKAIDNDEKYKDGWLVFNPYSGYVSFNMANTLTTSCSQIFSIGGRILISPDGNTWRRVTPEEMFRHQGLWDIKYDGISNSQAFKLAGNGWAITPFEKIMEEIYK